MRKELLMAALGLTTLTGCQSRQEKDQRINKELNRVNQTSTTNELPVMANCYKISIVPEREESVDKDTGDKTINIKEMK